jgi:hypothetical protein
MKRLLCGKCAKIIGLKNSEQQKDFIFSPNDNLVFSSFYLFHLIIPKQPTDYLGFF